MVSLSLGPQKIHTIDYVAFRPASELPIELAQFIPTLSNTNEKNFPITQEYHQSNRITQNSK